jgi:hypothetical protein
MAEPVTPLMKSRRRIACPEAQDYANNRRLHQGFMVSEMGCNDQFALQKIFNRSCPLGSKADIPVA